MIIIEVVIGLLIIVIPFLFLLKYGDKVIFYFPVIHILVDIIMGFIPLNTRIIPISRALISILIIVYIYLNHTKRFSRYGNVIVFFLIYTVFLPLFSSNFMTSFSGYLKVLITLLMFQIGYTLIYKLEDLIKLNRSLVIVLILVTLNFVFANLFKVGRTYYSSEVEFYAGNLQISALNTITMALLTLPVILSFEKGIYKKLAIVFGTSSFIFLLISLKRISILSVVFGLFVFLVVSERKSKALKLIVFSLILLFVTFPLYENVLYQQMKAREKQLQYEYLEKESRYLETFYVYDEIIGAKSWALTLFGKEIYNSAGNYANGIFGRRVIHSDINLVLHGTGVIGLILFILIYYYLLRLPFRFNRKRFPKNNKIRTTIFPTYISILMSGIVISITGGMLGITHRVIMFLYLGALHGIIEYNYLKLKKSKQKRHIG